MKKNPPLRDQSPRRIVLCADDFGMHSNVNRAILSLAEQNRLSASSVLVDGPAATAGIPGLLESGLQIGLHLNLTESFGQQGFYLPLRRLILAAYSGRLSRQLVQGEFKRQLSSFLQLTGGRAPDYVDGHQHVHQLPIVRSVVLNCVAATHGWQPWLRNTGSPRLHGLAWRQKLKARVIAALGARSLQKACNAYGYKQNPGFLGVYDFQGGEQAYTNCMGLWLAQARHGDVLMCHPAHGSLPGDPLGEQRQAEYAVLSGPWMGQQLQAHGLHI